MATPLTNKATRYARSVVNGRTPACRWVRLACQRHFDDLERAGAKGFPYRFDRDRAERVLEFAQLLPHTKDRWAARGERIKLRPWQCFVLAAIFGWVHQDTGLRRFREAYLEVPRKNGKSVLAAIVGLYCFLEDGVYGAEVYSGATTEKQAWEVFRPASLMVKRTPELVEHYQVTANASNLLRLSDFSRFEPLIGTPGDGASPSCALIDEFHEHDKPDLYDTMVTGMGAREQPLVFIITTAGSNVAGPCYEKRLEVQKILEGVFTDHGTFGIIYSIDRDDDWRLVAALKKANPNYDVSVSAAYLKSQIRKAIQSPSKQNTVKTKHLNVWTGAKAAWLNMESWAACADPKLDVGAFVECAGILAVDLATRIDLAARAHLFYRDESDGRRHYYLFPTFYLPEGALEKAKNAERYAGWHEQGLLNLMDGEEIDLEEVQDGIVEMTKAYRVDEFVYDPWRATQLAQNVEKATRIPVVEMPQWPKFLNPAMREMEAAIESGRFHHPDHPILNWNVSNVVAREDKKENLFPTKEAPDNKIDGAVAAIMAIARAALKQPARPSVYNKGVI